MTLLKVDTLTVEFGEKNDRFRAVDRISYTVDKGEVVGIVGESGSGKSVSSLAIMGLIDFPGTVTAERLEFDGKDLQTLKRKERQRILGDDVPRSNDLAESLIHRWLSNYGNFKSASRRTKKRAQSTSD